MKRKSLLSVVLAGSFLFLSACGGRTASTPESRTEVISESVRETPTLTSTPLPTPAVFSAKGAVKIEEIDWKVEESVLDGERFISFNYTNNSPYTILDMEIKFVQREGLTAQDLSVFDELKADRGWTDEEVANIYIEGSNHKCAHPGETVSDSPCFINGTGTLVQSMSQYELMEPDMMSIALIGDDGKGYVEYYDFKSQAYGESSSGGKDLHEWSDSELASLLPKEEFTAVEIELDDEMFFDFSAYDVTKEDFQSYLEAVKEQGFKVESYGDDTFYSADDLEGRKISLSYYPLRGKMDVSLYAAQDSDEE